jgi:hypothetical protein
MVPVLEPGVLIAPELEVPVVPMVDPVVPIEEPVVPLVVPVEEPEVDCAIAAVPSRSAVAAPATM